MRSQALARPVLMTRRRFAFAAATAAAVVAMPRVRAQARLEKTRLTIAVGAKSAFYSLPLTIAEQLGYFKSEGLEVDVMDLPTGARAVQALLAGAADVVSGAYDHTISMQGRGQYCQSIVLQGRAPQIAVGVSARAVPGFRGMADLRGKRMGVSAPGSSTNMVANAVLQRGGLRATDVSYIGVGATAGALAALRSGQIDAISNTDPVMTILEQRGEVKIIGDTRTLKGTQDVFGGPMPAACLFAPLEFVQKHPNTCQALAHAIVHSLKWLQTAGPSDIIRTVPEPYLLGDRALYLAAFNKVREAISVDGLLPEEGARTAFRAVAAFDSMMRLDKIDLARTYTNEFARRAKEKFKV